MASRRQGKEKTFVFGATVVTAMLMLSGCSLPVHTGRYEIYTGKAKREPLKHLEANWDQYYKALCGGSIATVAPTIFDPKDDELNLLGDGYIAVKDEKSIRALIKVMEGYAQHDPYIYKIFDDYGRFYGFVHLAGYRPELKRIDDRTLMLAWYESPIYEKAGR